MNVENIPQEIRRKHETLYQQANLIFEIKDETQLENLKEELKHKAEGLFSDLSNYIGDVLEIDEYNWFSDLAEKWQSVFSRLGIGLDVQKEIGIIRSPKYLKASPRQEISREYIEQNAFRLGAERIIWQKESEVREFRENYLRAYANSPSNQEEADSDWYNACKYLAHDVLSWKITINFSNEVLPDLYPYFENVWLEDVKQLKAYFFFREKVCVDIGQVLGSEMDDYCKACEEIRDMLLDLDIKAPRKRFLPTKEYIEANFLRNGKLDISKCFEKIQRKAYRIWQKTGRNNASENWEKALEYTKKYYENIIPACIDKEPTTSILAVIRALKLSEIPQIEDLQNAYSIMNSFEAAVSIYFLQLYRYTNLDDLKNEKFI